MVMNGTSLNRRSNYANPNPWNAFEAFNRAFAPLFSGDAATPDENETVARAWAPRVDILENETSYQVTAELPGVKKDDVEITVENNLLTLKGERKFEKDVNKEQYHRIERAYGTFARSFTLPNRVSQDQVQAKFDNGLLMITIPKAAEARPKKIEIA
jgi:HSP20 family protein